MEDIAKKGDIVEVDYTGTFENGDVFDTSEGREPLKFELGAGQMIPGFDKAVDGMKFGEEKTVTLPPEEAYGTSGPHPMAGKTLVFKITLVGINPSD
jgi:peptidylprolyl isomerase